MNNLIKSTFLPALSFLVDRSGLPFRSKTGAYAGIDVLSGNPFAGLQGHLVPADSAGDERTVQIAPSFESTRKSDAGRWQLNADVLAPLGSVGGVGPYVGGGLCVTGTSQDEEGMRPGINLLGGVNLEVGAVRVFIQTRLTLAGGAHLSLTGGALPKMR